MKSVRKVGYIIYYSVGGQDPQPDFRADFETDSGVVIMSRSYCPHCGDKLPIVLDAFCGTCGEELDEPPATPRTPEEQKEFRNKVEKEAKDALGWLGSLSRIFGR